MEGLIPTIYRSLKRSKSLRQRKHPAAQASPIHNIQDFYPDGYNFVYDDRPRIESSFDMKTKSMQIPQKWCYDDHAGGKKWPKKFVRFGSQRRIFSCITGAA
ncbi:hypothetical protein DCAR_0832035 [Daucus carota subsp. sativus]|uniref:Uncharacterized protein n=1 Tax=Daucus carota subsp. sativus TaxID=79200 RepID=A0A175YNA4_DAUCS|nr:hypothetical protein DCAR_0832035 [Daucus carota subsp. sativus]